MNGPICKIHYWLALADKVNEDVINDSESNAPTKPPTGTCSKVVLAPKIRIQIDLNCHIVC